MISPKSGRRQTLAAALRRAKPGDILSLENLAALWGSTKANFVNVRNVMAGFPDGETGPRNTIAYPAREAIRAMLDHETRADAEASEIARRQAAIMGRTRRGRSKRPDPVAIPLADMAMMSRLMAETEERERAQGEYAAVAETARVAGRVFSMISAMLSNLSATIDPNGRLPAAERAATDTAGRELLLKVHAEMRDTLSGNATPRRRTTEKSGNAPRRARRASPRREG